MAAPIRLTPEQHAVLIDKLHRIMEAIVAMLDELNTSGGVLSDTFVERWHALEEHRRIVAKHIYDDERRNHD